MSDTIKVVRACVIGSAVTVLAAIAVAPVLTWWLAVMALFAGFCGGCLSWEFREAVYAIPAVWQSFKKDLARWSQPFIRGYDKAIAFLKDGPHPFFWEWLLLTILFVGWSFFASKDMATKTTDGGFGGVIIFAGAIFVFSIGSMMFSFLIGFVITAVGANIWKIDWPTTPKEGEEEIRRKWKEVILWQITGVVMFVPFLFWQGVRSTCLFFKKYFIFIHSRKRLLCGFGGLLGGLGFAVWVWSDPAMPAVQKVLMVGCGDMLGGMFGFISYQLISIKWLKLVPKS